MKLARVSLALAFLAAAALAPCRAQAQGSQPAKPIAVVSFSGYKELIDDLNYIGGVIDGNELGAQVTGIIALTTQGKGLVGLDQTQPWGAAVIPDGDEIRVVGFLPIQNLKKFFSIIPQNFDQPEKREDGAYELAMPNGNTLLIKEQKGYAYLCRDLDEDVLAGLPADPTKLLGGLTKDYDLAVRINVQSLPEAQREMAVQQLQAGVQQGLERMNNESDEDFELRKQVVEGQMEQMTRLLKELDAVTVGLKIDSQNKGVFLDFGMTALSGSKLAKEMGKLKDPKTNFAGFVAPDAAITANWSMTGGSPEDMAQGLQMIDALEKRANDAIEKEDQIPDDEDKKKVKSALKNVLETIRATLKAGTLDGGALVKFGDEKMTIAFGGQVEDVASLEEAFKTVSELVEKKEPGFEGVQWDADKEGKVRFHAAKIPVHDEEAQRVLGGPADVIVGFGEKSAYFAMGQDALEVLKGVVKKSAATPGASATPVAINVSLRRILEFAAAQKEDEKIKSLAAALAESGDNDRITINATAIPGGFRYRIQLDEGVIKAIGKSGAQRGGGF